MEKIIRRGNVYWVDLDKVNTNEDSHLEKGARPCIVVSNNISNIKSSYITVVPVMGENKKMERLHPKINLKRGISYALCEQIYSIDKNLLERFITELTEEEMHDIEHAMKLQYGLD